MYRPNLDKIERDVSLKYKKKDKKKKVKMKISGGNVKKLANIIRNKGK